MWTFGAKGCILKVMKTKVVNFRGLFFSFLAFMLGIIVAKRFYAGEIEVIIVSLVAVIGVGVYFALHKSFKPLILILVFFFLGNGFYFLGEGSFNNKIYEGKVAVVGRISDDMSIYSYSSEVVLENASINGESCKNIRLTITNCSYKLNVGDIVAFESEIENSKPTYLKQFNSKDYRDGVGYRATVDYYDMVIEEGYRMFDESVRIKIKNAIYSSMSEDNAGIAYAVMFGDKSDLDGEVYTSYQKSGIIHVLTVSGLHVGFLVSLIYGTLKKLGANNIINLIISSVVIILYAYLCNFSPSVVRAGVMAICMMFAKAVHRKYDSLNALGLAGFILCLTRPLLALDTGFLMSFFCVFSIVMLSEPLTKLFKIVFPEKIATLIALSTSAQLGILPFVASMGGTLNLLSFLVNLIVVPIFSLLYPFLFIVSLLVTFLPFGFLLKLVDYLFIFINGCATFFGMTNLTIKLSKMGFALTIIYFAIIFVIGRYFMMAFSRKLAFFTGLLIALVSVVGLYTLPSGVDKLTSVSCLTAYSETCVVISCKNGTKVVVGENNLLERFGNNFDIYFSYYQLSDEKVSDLSELGFGKFITCAGQADSESENCEIVETNTAYYISNFEYNFVEYDQTLLGIIFVVDNQTIFVAKESNLSYNTYRYAISDYSPDIVIAGNASQLALGDEYICISNDEVAGSEYNYQKDGNLQLAFEGGTWIKRGLD